MARIYGSLLKRLVSRIKPSPDGCWLWTASTGNGGYGSISVDGVWSGAHRVAYEMFRAPIPEGLDLDHLCRVRRCCNPWHLEPVTRKENLRRGLTGQKTACHNGHPYTSENTYIRKSGKKQCRLCARISDRKRSLKSSLHVGNENTLDL